MEIINFILNIVVSIAEAIIEGIFYCLNSFITPKRKTEYDAGYGDDSVLSVFNKGVVVNGRSATQLKTVYNNILCLGATSTGKSSCIITPSIWNLSKSGSILVNDPSSEELKTCSPALQSTHAIKILNYCNPAISEIFNPLHHVKKSSDIHKISKILVHSSLGIAAKDPFWNVSCENVISMFAKYLYYHAPIEYVNFYNVLHLINTYTFNPEACDRIITGSNNSALITEYKAFSAFSPATAQGILASAKAALSIFNDEDVIKTTCGIDTMNLSECRKIPTAIFINNDVSSMRYYGVLTSLFFELFWGRLMSRLPEKKGLPVFCILDESSSLYLNSMHITISNIRKFRGSILNVFQSYGQMVDLYTAPLARTISENSLTKIFLPGIPIDQAALLEQTFGKFEFLDPDTNTRKIRPLMTAAEIHECTDVLIKIGNARILRKQLYPFYTQMRLRRLANLPEYHQILKNTNNIPPLLQIE